jgi:hypothetical protein
MRAILIGILTSIAYIGAAVGEIPVIHSLDRMPILVLSRTGDDMPMARIPGERRPLPDVSLLLAQALPSDAPMPVTIVGGNAPGSAKESVAFGDYAGAIIEWMVPIILPLIALMAGDLYMLLRTKLGLSTTDAQRDKFGEIVANGVALGAHDAQTNLAGKMTYDVKNQVMATAVAYAKTHGADTLKVLGVDPTSAEAEEAIRARVAKFLADAEAAQKMSGPTATAVQVVKEPVS